MVDVPSERAPSGAKGHRVVLTRRAAEAALPSLLGMGVDYSPALDRHDVRCKVGVITRAEIVGRNIELGGYLFARDFPEIVKEIANSKKRSYRWRSIESSRRRFAQSGTVGAVGDRVRFVLGGKNTQKRPGTPVSTIRAEAGMAPGACGLGMSYEVTEVQLEDSRAQVWMLERVTFTGAAILRRDKAAYPDTWIELG
jgi:hypothetical protein